MNSSSKVQIKSGLKLVAVMGALWTTLPTINPAKAYVSAYRYDQDDHQERHDRGRGRGRDNLQQISIRGVVLDSNNMPDTLRVQTRQGDIFVVHTNEAYQYRLYDRVRVDGWADGNTIRRATVSLD